MVGPPPKSLSQPRAPVGSESTAGTKQLSGKQTVVPPQSIYASLPQRFSYRSIVYSTLRPRCGSSSEWEK